MGDSENDCGSEKKESQQYAKAAADELFNRIRNNISTAAVLTLQKHMWASSKRYHTSTVQTDYEKYVRISWKLMMTGQD